MADSRMANHYCQANSHCVDEQDQDVHVKGYRCYGNEAMADGKMEVKDKPLCKDGSLPDPCRGCEDGSQILNCPTPTTSNCATNKFRLKSPFRWCNGVANP